MSFASIILTSTTVLSQTTTSSTNKTYHYIKEWGKNGTNDGEFLYPIAIAVDSFNNVYVGDTYSQRIQKFDGNGNFITKWGSNSAGDGQFFSPAGIAVDSSDNVYMADTENQRIQKFDSDGNFITKWGSPIPDDEVGSIFDDILDSANPEDPKGDEFFPEGIAVDSSNNVYITDSADRIQKFDRNGNSVIKWGGVWKGQWPI